MCYIVFIKNILHLDDILPLILELKKAGMVSQPLFITHNREIYEYLRKNIVLYEGIISIDGRLSCLSRYKNRYINQIYNIIVLRKYLYKKVISIETSANGGSLLISLLVSYNRKVLKGKIIKSLIRNRPVEQGRNMVEYYRIAKGEPEKKESEKRVVKGCDYILLSHTKEQFERIFNQNLITDCPIINVGYTRGLPEWYRYLDKNESRYIPGEIKKPFLFFNLSRTGRWITGEDSPPLDQILKECLLVLKKFNDDIMTVFKPHSKTDMDKAIAIIESTGYSNYVFSYSHPWLMIKTRNLLFLIPYLQSQLMPIFWAVLQLNIHNMIQGFSNGIKAALCFLILLISSYIEIQNN